MKVRTAAVHAGIMLLAGVAFGGRPLAIDDADPADTGQFEFEAGATHEHDCDCKHWDFPFALTYGLIPGVEVGVGFGGQFEERTTILESGEEDRRESGMGDLVFGGKWQLMESCPFGARHAIAPSVKLPTADDDQGLGSGETDCDLAWIASRSFGEEAGMHLNVGYSWIGGPDHNALHYGAAFDYQVADALQCVCEVFAEKELVDGADTVAQWNTGLRWNPTESLTLDIAGGSQLNGDGPDYIATVGLTWALDLGDNESK
jgi:hypothetical protein